MQSSRSVMRLRFYVRLPKTRHQRRCRTRLSCGRTCACLFSNRLKQTSLVETQRLPSRLFIPLKVQQPYTFFASFQKLYRCVQIRGLQTDRGTEGVSTRQEGVIYVRICQAVSVPGSSALTSWSLSPLLSSMALTNAFSHSSNSLPSNPSNWNLWFSSFSQLLGLHICSRDLAHRKFSWRAVAISWHVRLESKKLIYTRKHVQHPKIFKDHIHWEQICKVMVCLMQNGPLIGQRETLWPINYCGTLTTSTLDHISSLSFVSNCPKDAGTGQILLG